VPTEFPILLSFLILLRPPYLPPKTKINKNDKFCIFVVVLARAKKTIIGLRNRTKE
jgi:hypothetical protein